MVFIHKMNLYSCEEEVTYILNLNIEYSAFNGVYKLRVGHSMARQVEIGQHPSDLCVIDHICLT